MYRFSNIRILLSKISPVFNTRLQFFLKKKKFLNLKNPTTFDEKISYLKLFVYPYDNFYSKCADKVEVRDYVVECGLGHILNDLIYVVDKPRNLLGKKFPSEYVLKWNDDYGSTIIIESHSEERLNNAIHKLENNRLNEFYHLASELHYENIKPKIICEKKLSDPLNESLIDYKFYCFNGKVEYIMVCIGRNKGQTKFYFYDRNWDIQILNDDTKDMKPNDRVEKPDNLEAIIEMAEILANKSKFVRVDFYIIGDEVIFGEMTFTPAAGMDSGLWESTDKLFGNLLKLEEFYGN